MIIYLLRLFGFGHGVGRLELSHRRRRGERHRLLVMLLFTDVLRVGDEEADDEGEHQDEEGQKVAHVGSVRTRGVLRGTVNARADKTKTIIMILLRCEQQFITLQQRD